MIDVISLRYHVFTPIKYDIMDGFWGQRFLNDRSHLPDMIGSFETGKNVRLVAKNLTRNTIHVFVTSIGISPYREPKFDSSYFIFFFTTRVKILWIENCVDNFPSFNLCTGGPKRLTREAKGPSMGLKGLRVKAEGP